MSEEEKRYTEKEAHRFFGVSLNNKTWELLRKTDRTEEEDLLMVSMIHASYYHWLQVGKPENKARGEYMISRVYAILNQPQPALFYGQQCLETCQAHGIGDFDLAYAYEALARASAAAGNLPDCEKYRKLAYEAGQKIQNEEDRKIFVGDYEAEPWYNCK